MADILNLALKKDVFEGLNNGSMDTISIDNSKWWKKRLMDLDTGKFKSFDTARVSCGSADKIDYPIEKIELIDNKFVISIKRQKFEDFVKTDGNFDFCDNGDVEITLPISADIEEIAEQYEDELPEINTPVESSNLDKSNDTQEQYDENVSIETDFKKDIMQLLEAFCSNDNVFSITTPYVMIRPNGQVVSTDKYLITNSNNETRIYFNDEEITKYNNMSDDEFITYVTDKMKELLSGNYVFIRRKECGFKKNGSGNDVFVMRIAVRKTYQFRKK